MSEKFKVGDRVTWRKLPEYGTGTVLNPGEETAPGGVIVPVRFDGYEFYRDASEFPDHHTPYVADLEKAEEVPPPDFRTEVQAVLKEIEDILVEKNESYGNSALDPLNVFSKSSAVEGIAQRIDDKLSRLKRGSEIGEDTVLDLTGYLILYRMAKNEG